MLEAGTAGPQKRMTATLNPLKAKPDYTQNGHHVQLHLLQSLQQDAGQQLCLLVHSGLQQGSGTSPEPNIQLKISESFKGK